VFRAALGITVEHAEWLRERALDAATNGDAKGPSPSVFGDKDVIDSVLEFGDLSANVRFSWIIERSTDFPRLTSYYLK
jgi:hypothetical protein